MRERNHMANPTAQRHELFGARAERLPESHNGPVQRTQLFGSNRPGPGSGFSVSSSSSVNGSSSSSYMNSTTQALEEDNDRHTADLILKVAAVKQAALSIHDEVSEHNRLLSNMGTAFDRTQTLMSGALTRIDGLLRTTSGGNNYMCYLILFMVIVFFVLWRFLK